MRTELPVPSRGHSIEAAGVKRTLSGSPVGPMLPESVSSYLVLGAGSLVGLHTKVLG